MQEEKGFRDGGVGCVRDQREQGSGSAQHCDAIVPCQEQSEKPHLLILRRARQCQEEDSESSYLQYVTERSSGTVEGRREECLFEEL